MKYIFSHLFKKNTGNDRTKKVRINVLASFFSKFFNIFFNLLLVPLTLNYLDVTKYGIWMTITSIMSWFALFDIGLGNGLRNLLTIQLALNNKSEARSMVSTTYVIVSFVSIFLIFLFLLINNFLDWSYLLNTSRNLKNELSLLVQIVFILFFIKLIMQLVKIILIADQKPGIANWLEAIGNGLSLLGIYILIQTYRSSLTSFATVYIGVPVVFLFLVSLVLYFTSYKYLKPSFKWFKLSLVKTLFNTGIQFFIIQIAVIVIFQSSNILITHLFSPSAVTPYNIAFKYFGVLPMFWTVIMMPMWSAFTHALAQNDFIWIKKTLSKLNILMLLFLFLSLFMAIFGNLFIGIWTNHKVQLSNQMLIIFALYSIINIWNNTYSYFLNGIGLIKIQIQTSIVAIIINIPMSIFFVKVLGMGSEGICLSMFFSLLLFGVAGPIQSHKIIKKWKI